MSKPVGVGKPQDFVSHPVDFIEAKDSGAYRAVCKRVVDGDTYDFTIDVGLYLYPYERIRLADLDTYEVYGSQSHPLGKEAKNWCEQHLLGKSVLLYTGKDVTTFGRFVSQITVVEQDGRRWDLADDLRRMGFGKADDHTG